MLNYNFSAHGMQLKMMEGFALSSASVYLSVYWQHSR